MLLAAVLAVTAGLMGCGTPGVTRDLGDFAAGSAPRDFFELPEPITGVQKVGLANVEWEYGLAAGKYVAVGENDKGILFKGPGRCVMFHHSRGWRIQAGGVWLSKEAVPRLQLYVYGRVEFADYPSQMAAMSAQRTAAPPPATATAGGGETVVIEIPVTVPLTPGAAVAGGVIGTGIVNALVAHEIARETGKPITLFPAGHEELRRRVLGRAAGQKTAP